ncbi:hypothetical protein C0992_000247 [Termitomyces sp. T32_za158]|nr:hypothetical protein C0992_000247 [Termitomyces sp. T32_za158]
MKTRGQSSGPGGNRDTTSASNLPHPIPTPSMRGAPKRRVLEAGSGSLETLSSGEEAPRGGGEGGIFLLPHTTAPTPIASPLASAPRGEWPAPSPAMPAFSVASPFLANATPGVAGGSRRPVPSPAGPTPKRPRQRTGQEGAEGGKNLVSGDVDQLLRSASRSHSLHPDYMRTSEGHPQPPQPQSPLRRERQRLRRLIATGGLLQTAFRLLLRTKTTTTL